MTQQCRTVPVRQQTVKAGDKLVRSPDDRLPTLNTVTQGRLGLKVRSLFLLTDYFSYCCESKCQDRDQLMAISLQHGQALRLRNLLVLENANRSKANNGRS